MSQEVSTAIGPRRAARNPGVRRRRWRGRSQRSRPPRQIAAAVG
ncbi:hypothetical protein ABTK15_19930 [Acinetobacter baumannii]